MCITVSVLPKNLFGNFACGFLGEQLGKGFDLGDVFKSLRQTVNTVEITADGKRIFAAERNKMLDMLKHGLHRGVCIVSEMVGNEADPRDATE